MKVLILGFSNNIVSEDKLEELDYESEYICMNKKV